MPSTSRSSHMVKAGSLHLIPSPPTPSIRVKIKCSGKPLNSSPIAIDKGDKIISHPLKINDLFTLGIFHSNAFQTRVQCTISCEMFILKLRSSQQEHFPVTR